MGGFIDWTPLRNPGFLDNLMDPIVSAAHASAKRRSEQSRLDQELAFKREQEQRLTARDDSRHQEAVARQTSIDDRDNRRIDREEANSIGRGTVANVKGRAEAESKIRGALANDQFSEAQGIGRGYAEVDPKTGAVSQGMPVEKVARPLGPTPQGPIPEGADVAGSNADPEQMRAAQQVGRDAVVAEDAANPRYRIGDVETSRDELRSARSNADANDFETQVGPNAAAKGADGTAYARMLADEIRAKGLDPKGASAAWNTYLRDGTKMAFQAGEGDKNRQNRIDVQAMKPPPAGHAPGDPKFDFMVGKEKSGNLRKDLKTDFERFNAKTTQDAAQEFPNIVQMLKSGNGRLQDQALITMMRLAQKDNRFSDADAKLAMRAGAGWLDQLESGAYKAATGEIDGAVLENAIKAADALNGYYNNKNQAMNEAFDSYLQQPDFYNPREAGQMIARQLPGFAKRHPEFAPRRVPAGAPPEAGFGAPEDVNSAAPLPEDPEAASIDDYQSAPEVRALVGSGIKKQPARAAAPPAGKVTREQLLERARREGWIK